MEAVADHPAHETRSSNIHYHIFPFYYLLLTAESSLYDLLEEELLDYYNSERINVRIPGSIKPSIVESEYTK